jgi:hypothetical protein
LAIIYKLLGQLVLETKEKREVKKPLSLFVAE